MGAAAGAAAAPTFEGDDDMTLDEPQQSGDEEDLTHTGIANDDHDHHHHHKQQVRACMRGAGLGSSSSLGSCLGSGPMRRPLQEGSGTQSGMQGNEVSRGYRPCT